MTFARITTTCIAAIYSLTFAATATAENGVDEVERIQQHLADVEDYLRATDVSDWPIELQQERAERLDELREYREAGVFPRNLDFEQARVPYFIDDRGVACAVAHLMIESGYEESARAIAERENNAWLMEMSSPEVAAWVPKSGLTAEEAAWIQPTYGFCDDVFAEISGPTTAGCAETFELSATPVPEDSCGANYYWQLLSGEPAPTLDGEAGRTLSVTLPEFSGTIEYEFELSVSNQGHNAAAQHVVTATCGEEPVNNGSGNNGSGNNTSTNNSTNNDDGETNGDSEPPPTSKDPDSDKACSTGLGGTFTVFGLLMFCAMVIGRRRSAKCSA